MAASNGSALPVVDLAPFFLDDDEGGVARGRATEAVREACRSSRFFRVVNHGVPRELMARSLQLSEAFFALPEEEKAKFRSSASEGTSSVPSGYSRQPVHSVDRNEKLVVRRSNLCHNLDLAEPAGFREALVEFEAKLTNLALLIQEILNECMGLPRGFLREYNDDRTFDFISVRHYFPATKEDNSGTHAHQDASCITFVLQDNVGGLEALRPDGGWSPVEPVEGSIVVNLGDVMQVLSNDKFTSVMHRVVRKPEAHRYSLVFSFDVHGDKWVEPLPQFAGDIGEPRRYRGFHYSEYLQLRIRSNTHPTFRPEDAFDISHYVI